MTTTQKYIEMYRSKLEKATGRAMKDSDLVKSLDIPKQTFSRYKNGERQISNDIAIEIGIYLDLDPLQIIAELEAEKATREVAKNFWLKKMAGKAENSTALTLTGFSTILYTLQCILCSIQNNDTWNRKVNATL